jgi:hypothetical protein
MLKGNNIKLKKKKERKKNSKKRDEGNCKGNV